jgi:hypothetical protein
MSIHPCELTKFTVANSLHLLSISMSKSCKPSILFPSHLDVALETKYQFRPTRRKGFSLCYYIEQNEGICKVANRFQSEDNLFQG